VSWRFKEWEHEFDAYVRKGSLPNLMLIELRHDHFGSFGSALDGVNTPETQMADNDYALGLIAQKVARSPFADSTLIFVVEDDAQDGPDHVDAQRAWDYTAFIPEVLRTTQLPLPRSTAANSRPLAGAATRYARPSHDAAYWEEKMKGQDFNGVDKLDTDRFNRALWEGLMGRDVPYPIHRHGLDLSRNREALLQPVDALQPRRWSSARGQRGGSVSR